MRFIPAIIIIFGVAVCLFGIWEARNRARKSVYAQSLPAEKPPNLPLPQYKLGHYPGPTYEYMQFEACFMQEERLNRLGQQGWRVATVLLMEGSEIMQDGKPCIPTRHTLIRERRQ